MHQRKYFNLNFFINEIFSIEKFPNYGIIYNYIAIFVQLYICIEMYSYYYIWGEP